MKMPSPAVVFKSKFVLPESKEYKEYVDYIDREDAKVKRNIDVERDSNNANDFHLFHSFMDYMDDNEKEGELFSNEYDTLNNEEKKEMKRNFTLAQKNGSPMWQDVISFDNEWLSEQRLYDPETKKLDEDKVKNVVRESMSTLLKDENMQESGLWTASIHYNTDNIHVHIATVEPFPTREKKRFYDKENEEWKEQYRAKRKQGSLDKMKSKVANKIMDRSQDYNKIDELIRGTVHYKKNREISLLKNKRMEKLFFKSLSLLPDDLRQWKYGYQSINQTKPYIDEMVDIYLDTYHKDEMKELDNLLDKQVDISKRLYGEDSKHEQYKQTKLDDLKKRMGNAVLTEMREYVKESRGNYKQPRNIDSSSRSNINFGKAPNNIGLHYSMIRLTNSLRKTFHDYRKDRNIDEYDRMMEEGR